MTDFLDKICILGAGSSGLVAAKNLQDNDLAFDIIEKSSGLGGIWDYSNHESSVYRSTHLISSKKLTEFTSFPFSPDCPDYPSHRQALSYLQAFADAFDLRQHIQFDTAIDRINKSDKGWRVALSNGEVRDYAGVIIANGHLSDPKYPDYPGEFQGEVLHSKAYKKPDILTSKRVLVVGAGNSGCDIAVESAQNAETTFHSVRRGYHYIPKYMFGKPADQIGEMSLRLRLPLFLRRAINTLTLKLIYGRPQDFGLPKPDHRLFESHPIVNSQIYYYLGHGDIIPKPEVAELLGDCVRFSDGSNERVDLIIYATGYHISFPFIEKPYLNWSNGCPQLFLHVFHPEFDNLFVAGLIQPDSGQWALVDYQTQLIAKFLKAVRNDHAGAHQFRRLKLDVHSWKNRSIKYVQSSRHTLEVEHFSYRQKMKKLLKLLPG